MRRDFRLRDNPALFAAAQGGRPVIPVFIHDEVTSAFGAAPAWRLGQSIKAFSSTLSALGSKLVLRKGNARDVLEKLLAETGAKTVYWSRDINPNAIERDTEVKSALKSRGYEAQSFPGQLLWDPWTIKTDTGGPYRVYSPFWKKARQIDPGPEVATPTTLNRPQEWPRSDALEEWKLASAMHSGAEVLEKHALPAGEAQALQRLENFLENQLGQYAADRDRMDREATSGLSAYLAAGEISPRTIWYRAYPLLNSMGKPAEKFLSEVAWREFAYHLLYHFPRLPSENWREGWQAFPWRGENEDAERWRRGETGVDIVDAAMREMYVTGTMHNRARMICASYLSKHLLTDWRIGMKWFEDCLVDWDPASNSMGWQWVAGCGPDAAPYFRIFNPETQAAKFDPDGIYRARYLPGHAGRSSSLEAEAFFTAAPRSWNLDPKAPRPAPSISLADGRARALAAYESLKQSQETAA